MDYFESFMRDVLKDLETNGKSYVFSSEQVEYIKKNVKEITVINKNGIYYLSVDK